MGIYYREYERLSTVHSDCSVFNLYSELGITKCLYPRRTLSDGQQTTQWELHN